MELPIKTTHRPRAFGRISPFGQTQYQPISEYRTRGAGNVCVCRQTNAK